MPTVYDHQTNAQVEVDVLRARYEEETQGLGKFEGQAPWVPYLYELSLHGCGGECECHCDQMTDEEREEAGEDFECCCDSSWETFSVDEADRLLFPELAGVSSVRLFYSSSGFVIED